MVVTPLSLSARGDLYGSFNIAVICCHCAGSCNGNLMLLKREEMVCIQLLREPGQNIFLFFFQFEIVTMMGFDPFCNLHTLKEVQRHQRHALFVRV